MIGTHTRRLWTERIMFGLTGLATGITIGVLLFIIGFLVWMGSSSLSVDFFTKLPAPVGETGGGMANAIAGTGKLLMLAAAFGIPVGFLGGVYLAEFGRGPVAFAVRYAADVLNGVPSIVIGVCVYALVVKPMGHFSTMAGGLALGIMMIPVTIRTTEEFLRLVPQSLRDGALALGAPEWITTIRVVVPAALRGVVAGVILAVARVAGETAPLLFTAFGNRYWSNGWNEPTASLPVMIYTYAISPYDDWHRQAWAAALVLLLLVLSANILARLALRQPGPRRAGH